MTKPKNKIVTKLKTSNSNTTQSLKCDKTPELKLGQNLNINTTIVIVHIAYLLLQGRIMLYHKFQPRLIGGKKYEAVVNHSIFVVIEIIQFRTRINY